MSYTQAELNLMGITNNYWGVCGFTSTFYAMFEMHPGRRATLGGAGVATQVLAEIKTYLMLLQEAGQITSLNEIREFTQSFGVVNGHDFGHWNIADYIDAVDEAVDRTETAIRGDPGYSIGMPPHVVVDYLSRVWGFNSAVETVSAATDPGVNGIVGVSKGLLPKYDGLCHYMYRLNGKIHSWGNTYDSIPAANPDYRIVRLIRV